MDPRRYFTTDQLAAVAAAARAAEGRSGGEIVPYVVGRCDDYPEAGWLGGLVGAIGAAGLIAAWPVATGSWLPHAALLEALAPVAGAILGYAAAAVPAVRRRLVAPETLDRRVRLRAEAAFLEEGVFNTQDRTGVLILLALFEHRAVVLADAGIHARVQPGEWDALVAHLTAGARAGRPAAALVEAIETCGAILARQAVPLRSDDSDELPDAVRLREQ